MINLGEQGPLYDGLYTAVLISVVVLGLVSLFRWARLRQSAGSSLIDLFVILVPLAGPAVYLIWIGPSRRRSHRA